jgi:hypothetical protein
VTPVLAKGDGTLTEINDPVVVSELAALHEAYEAALVGNDVEKLTEFFWDSPDSLRFGVAECLYGAEQIRAFRKARPAIDLTRKVINLKIVALGKDTGVVTIEFLRENIAVPQHGRQSQVWQRFPDGWKVVSAHVSLMPKPGLHETAAAIGLKIPPEMVEGVRTNLERAKLIAQPLLDITMHSEDETAPVFAPGKATA